jgi:Glycosyltransferase
MKVLHVIDTLNVGGAEKVFVMLTSLLRKQGVHCDALLLHNVGQLLQAVDPQVTLYTLDRTNKYSAKKLKQAHDLCKQYDIIHVHLRHCYAYIRLAQIIFKGKYKLILHDHSSMIPPSKPFRLAGIFKPRFYIGVSEKMTKWAKYDLQIANCFTLSNTISSSADINYQYPGDNEAILISNIREVKQIPLAIEICQQANLALTIYGNRQDETYFETVAQIANAAKVQIKGNVVDFTDIFSNYSIALHTSRSETGPLVLLEYLANGIPFLAYNTGSVAETIAHELPLHFINTFHTNDWVERIIQIRAQGDISQKLKKVFSKYYSADDYVQQCLNIYESVLY